MALSSFHNLIVPQNLKPVNRQFNYDIRIYSEITNAATKDGLQNQSLFSMLLKSLNITDSGVLDRKKTIEDLKKYFNYSTDKIYRLLKSGNHIFFDADDKHVIILYSYAVIAILLNVKHVSKPKILNIKGMKSSEIRSNLYSATFETIDLKDDTKPMSRKLIKNLTGIKPQTQRRYEKAAKVEVKRNYSNEKVVYYSKNKKYVSAKQFGNSYKSTKLKIGCKEGKRKLNKKLNTNFERSLVSGKASKQNQSLKFCTKKASRILTCKDYFVVRKTEFYTLWELMPKIVS